MKKIFSIIFLGSLLFPFMASAGGTYMACIDEAEGLLLPGNKKCDPARPGKPAETFTMVYYDGLVPCGKAYCTGDNLNIKAIENSLTQGNNLQNACSPGNGGTYRTRTLEGTSIEVGFPCTFCHLFVMLDGIFDFLLFQLVPVIAVLMLVIGGAMYIFAYFGAAEILPEGAKGGPALLGQAKKLMTSVVIGLIIIYAGWLVIDLFFDAIGVAEWTGLNSGWFSIKCQIALPFLPPT